MSDLIKREDAIKAMEQRYEDILRTFKRKVKVGEKAIVLDMIGCVKNLPSAGTEDVRPLSTLHSVCTKMSDDLIKRSDAIEVAKEFWYKPDIAGALAELPTIEPKRGEWISNHDGSWNCSECGLRVFIYAKGNYCPNCGARMKGAEDADE